MNTFKKSTLFLLLIVQYGFAQIPQLGIHQIENLPANPKFEHLSPSDGLSSSSVNTILQDSRGFMWFGTNDGLNRYDGRNFKIFRRPNGLNSNFINVLHEDERQNLWVATEQGMQFLPLGQQQFQSPKLNLTIDWHGKLGRIQALLKKDSCFIIPAEKGCFQLCSDGEEWHLSQLIDVRSYDVEVDGKGRTWIASEQGLLLYQDGEISRHSRIDVPTLELHLKEEVLWSSTKDGRIFRWSIQSDSILVFDDFQKQWSIDWIEEMLLDGQDRLWINPYGDGVYVLDATSMSLISSYQFQLGNRFGLRTNLLESIFIDRSGILWAGTANTGVEYYAPFANKQFFNLLRNDPEKGFDLGVNGVHGVFVEPDQTVWLGTDGGGMFVLEPDDTSANNFTIQERFFAETKDGIPSAYSYIVVPENDSIFWIPDWGGLSRLNLHSGDWNNYYTDVNSKEGRRSVMALASDSSGVFWMGTWSHGIGRFDPATFPEIDFAWYDKAIPGGIGENRIEALLVDHLNRLWIGTVGAGLSLLDTSRTQYRHFRHDESDSTSIGSDLIYSLYQSDENTIWVGTHSGGLNKLDLKTGTFTSYTTEDGLPNNVIYGILPDEYGYLWLSTNLGLARFNPASERFKNFDVRDGLQDNEFNRHAAYRGADGMLYFGGINGLTYFHPKFIQQNEYKPPLAFSKLLVNQKEIEIRNNLRLPYDENLLEFEFVALNYEQPQKNQYRFRLIGVDREWINSGTRNSVVYSHLSPGHYTFEVQGSNNDRIWNEKSLELHFRILPPWWLTWWAFVLYGLLIVSLLYTFYTFQLNKKLVQSEANRLKELDQLKSRLYTNITHEFRTPLSIILGVARQVKREKRASLTPQVEMIERNGQQLLRLVNQLLDLSKIESGKFELNYQRGDIINFLKYLTESFHSLAEQKAIQLHFLSDFDQLEMDFDQECLQQIFYNLLSNALKFTPEGGHIYLQVTRLPEPKLEIKIKDTGIGIPEDQLSKIFDRFYQLDDSDTRRADGSGIGLALVKELTKQMEGEISVKSKPNRGTEFILILPIQQQAPIASKIEKWNFLPDANQSLNPVPAAQDNGLIDAPTVLVIEDNLDVSQYIQNCLSSFYQVELALDGSEGLQRAQKIIPDIIVCDVMMPLKNGYEVCNILKNDHRTSHIPIVMLTAKADFQSKLQGLKIGADIYLTKPFQEEELLLHLQNLLLHRTRLQQHYLFYSGFQSPRNSGQGAKQVLAHKEADFVENVKAKILNHLTDSTFTVRQLSREMTLSESQLHRKLKALTGYSANKMIRITRLNNAQKLLRNNALTIATVAYDSGFNDPDYMAKVFKKEFGMTPTEFRMKQKATSE